jgi:predicted transposase/invertase (TIGR01784 family)
MLMSDEVFYSPRNDALFKLLFGDKDNVELLRSFLSSVLDLPDDEFDDIEFLETIMKREFIDGKLAILDVRLKTKSKKTVHVEIQVASQGYMRNRSMYYTARLITDQIGKSGKYSELKRVISIIITDFPLLSESEDYHNYFVVYEPIKQFPYTDLLEIHTLEIQKLPADDDGTKSWEWMKFLDARNQEEMDLAAKLDPVVGKAVAVVKMLTEEESTRLIIEAREKQLRDFASAMEENREEGREEGIEVGIKVGREEGIDIGISKVAIRMIALNKDIDEIVDLTGMTRDEVLQLRSGLSKPGDTDDKTAH